MQLISATVTNVVGTGLSRPLLNDPDRLARLSPNAVQVTGGALLELAGAGASVGIAIALYSVLRKRSAGLALGAVVLLLTAWLLALFTQTSMLSYLPLALPLGAQEVVLAVWLIAKGFSISALPGTVQPPPPIANRSDHARALV